MFHFQGRAFHSCEWDHSYDLKDKTVAVIGTGPTAVQVVPSLAQSPCKKLYVMQRSMSHLGDKPQANMTSRSRWVAVYSVLPFVQRLQRLFGFLFCESMLYPALKPGFVSSLVTAMAIKDAEKFREAELGDDETLMRITKPRCLFGKRILLSSELWRTYRMSKVRVVSGTIDRITANGVVFQDDVEEIDDVDCIVYCTGFRTQEFLSTVEEDVVGRNGQWLQRDLWRGNDCSAYLGVTVHGFPNLFMLYGPGTVRCIHKSQTMLLSFAV